MQAEKANTAIKLYFVRHAEAVGMREGVRLGAENSLTEEGQAQSLVLASRFSAQIFDKLFSSPTPRATKTAEAIAHQLGNLTTEIDSDLVERREPSSFINKKTSDLPWEMIRSERIDPDWRLEDAESLNEILTRISRFMTKIEALNATAKVIAVSHGSFIRAAVVKSLLGEELTPQQYYRLTERMAIKPTGITELEYSQAYFESNASWKLIKWMDDAHLTSAGEALKSKLSVNHEPIGGTYQSNSVDHLT